MKRISLRIFALAALVCAAPMLSMEQQPNQNQNYRIVTAAQAKAIANKAIETLILPGLTNDQRRAAMLAVTTQLNQSTVQNTVALPRLREIMVAVAATKNINAEAMDTAYRLAIARAESAPKGPNTQAKPSVSAQTNAQIKFHNTYGSLILLDRSLSHLPVLHLVSNQQPRNVQDRTCGGRAVANARALDVLCDANRPVCSEHLRHEAATVLLALHGADQNNLAADQLRDLANQANIHNFYILDAQAYGRDKNYQITFGDTANGFNADPATTAGNLELDLINIAGLGVDQTGAVHFFCNLARKNSAGVYASGHWILVSVVKEANRPAVIMYQDSGNGMVRPNTLNHLYLYEVIALCNKHANLFTNLGVEVDTTVIDRARGNVNEAPEQEAVFGPNDNNAPVYTDPGLPTRPATQGTPAQPNNRRDHNNRGNNNNHRGNNRRGK